MNRGNIILGYSKKYIYFGHVATWAVKNGYSLDSLEVKVDYTASINGTVHKLFLRIV